MTYSGHYELSIEQQMWIMLDFLPRSWEHEIKVLTRRISNLTHNNIVSELNQELERGYKALLGDLAG